MVRTKSSLMVHVLGHCIRQVAVLVLVVAGATLMVAPRPAQAISAFARQTGQPCSSCHTDFPQLTPFGRRFKLMGYTLGGGATFGEPGWLPLSAQVIPTFTETKADQNTAGGPSGLSANNNFIFQEASVWYAGAITEHTGIMLQGDYFYPATAGFGRLKYKWNWDMLDLRYADTGTLGGVDLIYGATLNNQPAVQDVWNSVPAWAFPFQVSTIAPTPTARTIFEGAFTQRVLGVGGYAFVKDMLYLEATGYKTLSTGAQNSLGIDPTGAPGTLQRVAPYLRVALDSQWDKHSLEVGTFLFITDVNPMPWIYGGINPATGMSAGHDHYNDVGGDVQYQYQGENYWVTLRGYYIHENQNLGASTNLIGSNPTNTLKSFHANASWAYGIDSTVVLTGGYFNLTGSADPALYGPGTAANSASASPNSTGWIAEIAYMPFNGNNGPKIWPLFNARIGLQYVWYNRFNGASTNYDGNGTNANANNTLFVYGQFTF